jgi:hypothetical protein
MQVSKSNHLSICLRGQQDKKTTMNARILSNLQTWQTHNEEKAID